jgi:photosystem II stability/assembly factor-like uncharacterized protein
MKKSSLVFLSILISFCFSNQINAQWITTNTGLTVQDANSFARIGTDLFVGTGNISGNSTGVFKSTNNGVSWTAVNNGLTNLNVQKLIASGTTLFAAIGASGPPDGGVYRSTDNGANWVPCNTGLTYAHAYNIAVLGSTLYVSSVPNTVFTSTDNGDNWTAATDPVLVDTHVKTIITAGPNQLIASDGGGIEGVIISTNGGTSWSTTSIPGHTDDLQLIGNIVYAAVGDGGVYRSDDFGVSWDSVGIPGHNATALEAVDTMLIVGCPYSVYSSCDRGQTWTDISVGAGGANLSIEAFGMDANNVYIANTFHSVGVWSRPITELTCVPAGIEDEDIFGSFSIYPNPSSGIVNISNNGEPMETMVEVYNLTGLLIYRGVNSTQVDLTNQPNGIFIIKIIAGEDHFCTRIIKQ